MEKLDHLGDHTLTYWEHWRHSMGLACRMAVLSLKSVVHAFAPNTFPDDGPTTIYDTYHEIKDLPNVKKLFDKFDSASMVK